MAKLVSKTYGEALFELAMEQDALDAYLEQTTIIRQVIEENPDFSKLMNHPKIDKDEKLEVIKNVFEGKVDNELVGFLRLILIKDRYDELMEILSYFIDLVKEEKGIGVAYVTSATPLTEAQKKQVEEKLLATTDYKEMEITYAVEEKLIAGLTIRIGDKVVDSSVATKLEQLKKQLMKIQLA